MKRLPLLCYLLFITTIIIGQSQPYQQVVPTSPTAAAITKIADYPVSLNTGVPDIGIPLYEIKTGGISLPIRLSYHAAGFKIHEQSTNVGLGWTLACEPMITRTVNGLDDLSTFSKVGYANNTKLKAYYQGDPTGAYPFASGSAFPSENLYRLAAGLDDGQPDKFNYKLLNKSGSFYFEKGDNGAVIGIIPSPYDNIRIQRSGNNFIITDTDGTTYYFTEQEISYVADPEGNITAWKCSKIVNASQTDEILFTYAGANRVTNRKMVESLEYYHSLNSPGGYCDIAFRSVPDIEAQHGNVPSYQQLFGYESFPTLSSPKYFKNYGNAKQEFHMAYVDPNTLQLVDKTFPSNAPGTGNGLSGSMTDPLALTKISYRGGYINFTGTDKLTALTIYDQLDNEIKKIQLYQSTAAYPYTTQGVSYNGAYFTGTTYLDSIEISAQNQPYEKYAFVYLGKPCFGGHLIGSDAWGYRNSQTEPVFSYIDNNTKSIPPLLDIQNWQLANYPPSCTDVPSNYTLDISGNGLADIPDEYFLPQGTLKRILYPSGGYTDFDFEVNKYNEKLVPFSDINNDRDAVPRRGGGLRIRSISHYDGINFTTPAWQKYYQYGELENGMGILVNKPAGNFNSYIGTYEPFKYTQKITYCNYSDNPYADDRSEWTPGYEEVKTTFLSASYINYAYPNGAPIYYTKVTEYQKDSGLLTGKNVYEFDVPWKYSNSIYSGAYVPIVEANHFIPETNIPYQLPDGLMGQPKSIEAYKLENCGLVLKRKQSYEYTPYYYPRQLRVAYSFFKTIYRPFDPGMDFNFNIYDDSHGWTGDDYVYGQYPLYIGKILLTKEEDKIYEQADSLVTVSEYSYDNNSYYKQPTSILTTDSKGQAILKTLKYPYNFPSDPVLNDLTANNIISPVIEETLTNISANKELQKTFSSYKYYPETWVPVPLFSRLSRSYNGSGFMEAEATISKYDAKANILEMVDKKQDTTSYLWSYNSLYPVATLTGMPYTTANTLVNADPSQPSLNDLYNTAQIKTRLQPLQGINNRAQVQTFSYKPFVGMTDQTNATGITTYYNYDPYGRLSMIKDGEGKIEKSIGYKLIPFPNMFSASYPPVIHKSPMTLPESCLNFPQYTQVKLSTYTLINTVLSAIEFYKDGALFKTENFAPVYPDFSNYYEPTFNVPVGTFEVRFKALPGYNAAPLHYYYNYSDNDPNAGGFAIQSGTKIQFREGITYTFYVDNIFD